MKAAKLSCLCAAEGSGTHIVGDAFQHIKKNYLNLKSSPIAPSINARPCKDEVHAEWSVTVRWVVLCVCFAQKNMIRVLLADNGVQSHLFT